MKKSLVALLEALCARFCFFLGFFFRFEISVCCLGRSHLHLTHIHTHAATHTATHTNTYTHCITHCNTHCCLVGSHLHLTHTRCNTRCNTYTYTQYPMCLCVQLHWDAHCIWGTPMWALGSRPHTAYGVLRCEPWGRDDTWRARRIQMDQISAYCKFVCVQSTHVCI